MNIVIASDAWKPQINGVVTTLGKMVESLRHAGYNVLVIEPSLFKTMPCPGYSEISLALFPYNKAHKLLKDFAPDIIHIATEGPIGLSVRRYCLNKKLSFTTSFHTRFPEYLRMRAPVPLVLSYAWLRWFHKPATHTLVPTPSTFVRLKSRGFSHLHIWGRGVDTNTFRRLNKRETNFLKPRLVYAGRIAVEKNLEAFLSLQVAGEKILIGDGPDREMLEKKYPEATFLGYKQGEELVKALNKADVFVFPSRTDTFGVVMLKANACGIPVAAFPVEGPRDVIIQGVNGYMHEDLETAIERALGIGSESCRRHAEGTTWESVAETFRHHLVCNKTGIRFPDLQLRYQLSKS